MGDSSQTDSFINEYRRRIDQITHEAGFKQDWIEIYNQGFFFPCCQLWLSWTHLLHTSDPSDPGKATERLRTYDSKEWLNTWMIQNNEEVHGDLADADAARSNLPHNIVVRWPSGVSYTRRRAAIRKAHDGWVRFARIGVDLLDTVAKHSTYDIRRFRLGNWETVLSNIIPSDLPPLTDDQEGTPGTGSVIPADIILRLHRFCEQLPPVIVRLIIETIDSVDAVTDDPKPFAFVDMVIVHVPLLIDTSVVGPPSSTVTQATLPNDQVSPIEQTAALEAQTRLLQERIFSSVQKAKETLRYQDRPLSFYADHDSNMALRRGRETASSNLSLQAQIDRLTDRMESMTMRNDSLSDGYYKVRRRELENGRIYLAGSQTLGSLHHQLPRQYAIDGNMSAHGPNVSQDFAVAQLATTPAGGNDPRIGLWFEQLYLVPHPLVAVLTQPHAYKELPREFRLPIDENIQRLITTCLEYIFHFQHVRVSPNSRLKNIAQPILQQQHTIRVPLSYSVFQHNESPSTAGKLISFLGVRSWDEFDLGGLVNQVKDILRDFLKPRYDQLETRQRDWRRETRRRNQIPSFDEVKRSMSWQEAFTDMSIDQINVLGRAIFVIHTIFMDTNMFDRNWSIPPIGYNEVERAYPGIFSPPGYQHEEITETESIDRESNVDTGTAHSHEDDLDEEDDNNENTVPS